MNLNGLFSKHPALIVVVALVFVSVGAFLYFGNTTDEQGASSVSKGGEVWTCSMHPQVRMSTPGSCPICSMRLIQATVSLSTETTSRKIVSYRSTMMPGEVSQTPRKDSMGMDMVPVYASGDSMLELSEHARAMANVETVPVQRRRMSREIRMVGKVQYNETAIADITTRVEGYVERLFVDYTGIDVKPGDRLVEIYSPDLLVTQQELLIALDSPGNANLVESARRKLLLWGLTQGQVDDLVRDKKVSDRITLFSPIRGTVTEKMVVQKAMVKPGELLYRLVDLESVWIYLDIYEYELPWVQYGQMVEIKSEAIPDQSFMGRVFFISPVLDEETRTVNVLCNIKNTEHKLKPGMYVSAVIRAETLGPKGEQLLLTVPLTAVLDSGVRKIVYVERARGQFVPVEIVTGPRTEDAYPVLSGLNEGDRVAVRGSFLLDSQFQISGLPSLFYKEGQAAVTGHQHDGASPPPASPARDAKPQDHDQHKAP